jgi:predicted DNA-binding protein (UPF0251 family)
VVAELITITEQAVQAEQVVAELEVIRLEQADQVEQSTPEVAVEVGVHKPVMGNPEVMADLAAPVS